MGRSPPRGQKIDIYIFFNCSEKDHTYKECRILIFLRIGMLFLGLFCLSVPPTETRLTVYRRLQVVGWGADFVRAQKRVNSCQAGGKPSTWFPPGGLVEHPK